MLSNKQGILSFVDKAHPSENAANDLYNAYDSVTGLYLNAIMVRNDFVPFRFFIIF